MIECITSVVFIRTILLGLLIQGCFAGPRLTSQSKTPLLSRPPHNAITFWGHATCYIDVNGVGIVTDPVLVKSYSPFHRREVPAPLPSAYADAGIILISHAHRDHLSPKTLSWFPKSATVLCAEPTAKIIRKLGMRVQVMRPGDSCTFRGGSIVAVLACHPGGRNSLKARADGGALGFIIRTPAQTLYYSGDTEYFSGLCDIGATCRPDVAILNVNGHLTAVDAVRAYQALGAARVIPIHFGAYGGPTAKRNRRLHDQLLEMLGSICIPLEVGESYPLSIRAPDGAPHSVSP